MSSNIFKSLKPEEIVEASEFASKFVKEFVGRPLDMIAVTNAMMLEFVTRHTQYTFEDIASAAEIIGAVHEARGDVGSITTAKISKDKN